jgi:flavorubredoxin
MIDTRKIGKGLYQMNTYVEPSNLSFNQFLFTGAGALLVHTGPVRITQALLPRLESLLGTEDLAYVFASHFESDECGGLAMLLERYPELKVLCSEITGRQLSGFGITDACLIQKGGGTFKAGDWEIEFVTYPSEMHNWDGLIAFEKTRSVVFSSDLFTHFGKLQDEFIHSDWALQVESLDQNGLLPKHRVDTLQKALGALPVSLIAPGHGTCHEISAPHKN